MNYYLTKLTCRKEGFRSPIEVIQLVKASNKVNARKVVYENALEELSPEDIIEIRVNDTLFGE